MGINHSLKDELRKFDEKTFLFIIAIISLIVTIAAALTNTTLNTLNADHVTYLLYFTLQTASASLVLLALYAGIHFSVTINKITSNSSDSTWNTIKAFLCSKTTNPEPTVTNIDFREGTAMDDIILAEIMSSRVFGNVMLRIDHLSDPDPPLNQLFYVTNSNKTSGPSPCVICPSKTSTPLLTFIHDATELPPVGNSSREYVCKDCMDRIQKETVDQIDEQSADIVANVL